MKKLLFICAAVVLAAACNSGDKYTIKGTVTGDSDKLVNGTAYLFNRDRENPIRDTRGIPDHYRRNSRNDISLPGECAGHHHH